jgi:hypothetical protein
LAAQVQSQVRSCQICDGQKRHWGGFSRSTSISPANSHSTNYSTFINCPILHFYAVSHQQSCEITNYKEEGGKKKELVTCSGCLIPSTHLARCWWGPGPALNVAKEKRNNSNASTRNQTLGTQSTTHHFSEKVLKYYSIMADLGESKLQDVFIKIQFHTPKNLQTYIKWFYILFLYICYG